jgi:hypothetical protein
MYFLAGSWGGDPAGGTDRTIADVPANTPILVPIFNNIAVQFTTDPKSFDNKVQAGWKVNVNDLFLKIDGTDVKNLQSDLVRTPYFSAGNATPDTISSLLADPATGTVSTAKSAGYWAVIGGLSPGEHTIEFGGTSASGFGVHVTDHISVV